MIGELGRREEMQKTVPHRAEVFVVGERKPRVARRDVQIIMRDRTQPKKSVETVRNETLHELETVNETIEKPADAPTLRAARREKTKIEERLAAIDERRLPTVAYHDARTRYETATTELHETKAAEWRNEKFLDDADRKESQRTILAERRAALVEEARFWRAQMDTHGQRLAEEQVEHDTRAFDLDLYRRGLERKYAELAANESEYEDDAPELLEMAFLKQKMRAFAARMEQPKLQRRLRVERDRMVLARTAERTTHAIQKMESVRRTLNLLNPFHWNRILDADEQLRYLRHELEKTQMRAKLLTTTPTEEEMVEPIFPRTQPRGMRGTRAQIMEAKDARAA